MRLSGAAGGTRCAAVTSAVRVIPATALVGLVRARASREESVSPQGMLYWPFSSPGTT